MAEILREDMADVLRKLDWVYAYNSDGYNHTSTGAHISACGVMCCRTPAELRNHMLNAWDAVGCSHEESLLLLGGHVLPRGTNPTASEIAVQQWNKDMRARSRREASPTATQRETASEKAIRQWHEIPDGSLVQMFPASYLKASRLAANPVRDFASRTRSTRSATFCGRWPEYCVIAACAIVVGILVAMTIIKW